MLPTAFRSTVMLSNGATKYMVRDTGHVGRTGTPRLTMFFAALSMTPSDANDFFAGQCFQSETIADLALVPGPHLNH